MFARIAAETFEDNAYLLPQKHLEQKIISYLQKLPSADSSEDIDGEAVLRAIEAQHGIFVERSKGYYSFSHLTFQEYFTARYIVEHTDEGTLEGLIRNHCTDDIWREVFLLTAEMLDKADKFFDIVLTFLDEFVKQDKRLRQLLTTVEQETAALQIKARPFEKRWVILDLMLDTASFIDPGYNMDIGLFRTPTRAIAHAIAYARFRASTHAHALACTRTLTLDHAKELSKEHLPTLYKTLKTISVPSEDDGPEAWQAFSQTLLDIFQAHFPLEDYAFTEEQAVHVGNYVSTTGLLLECLQNAYVSDREAILERLLRVPQDM